MVDVSLKDETERVAIATGEVRMSAAALGAIRRGAVAKGDVLAVARVAGLQGLKRTAELVPLCHPVRITGAGIELSADTRRRAVRIRATVRARDRTGVEMEAMSAVAVAALAVYDMAKAIDRAMVISQIRLEEKRGGRSGVWRRR